MPQPFPERRHPEVFWGGDKYGGDLNRVFFFLHGWFKSPGGLLTLKDNQRDKKLQFGHQFSVAAGQRAWRQSLEDYVLESTILKSGSGEGSLLSPSLRIYLWMPGGSWSSVSMGRAPCQGGPSIFIRKGQQWQLP